MKIITITCENCGKSRTIKADNELLDEISNATLVLCQNTNCKQAYPLKKEKGVIRKVHLFGDFWSFDKKATVEEKQGVWRANQILHKALKEKNKQS